jgi:hypothetical protein
MNFLGYASLVVGGIGLLVFISFLFSWPVYMLWNGCLVGAVAGVSEVTWLQAWGLTVLCSFLFKSSTVSNQKG